MRARRLGVWLAAACVTLAGPSAIGRLLHEPEPADRRIVAGGGDAFAPFHYLDEQGHPAGFDIDLLEAVGRVTGTRIEICLGPWQRMREAMDEGELDLIVGMSFSDDRRALYEFSAPSLAVHYKVFVASDDAASVRSLDDLAGRLVLYQRRGVMDGYLEEVAPEARIEAVNSAREGLRRVAIGDAFGFVTGEFRGLQVLREGALTGVVPAGPPLHPTEYGFAARAGDKTLVRTLNQGLAIVHSSGEYDEIYERWFGVADASEGSRFVLVTPLGLGILGALSAVIVLVLTWTWMLRRRVASKTRELEQEFALRRETERAKAESEERFQRVFQFSPELTSISSWPDGVLLDVNDAFVELTGYAREEALGRTALALRLWADPELRRQIVDELREGRTVLGRPGTLRRRDNQLRTVLVSCCRVELGGQPCILLQAAETSPRRHLTGRERPVRADLSETSDADSRGSVLLVEDQTEVCALLDRMLTRLGYHVIATTDPRAALRLARDNAERIDVVMTDVIMPALSGRDLAERIREIRPDVPVVYVSGYDNDELREQLTRDDTAVFLRKPVVDAEIEDVLGRLLDRRAASVPVGLQSRHDESG